ncbi:MAG: J domain-containing protein [Thermoplasmatota archaeon]
MIRARLLQPGSILGIILFSCLIAALSHFSGTADGVDVKHPEYLLIDLTVNLDDANSGDIVFFMGTDDRREQNATDLRLPPQDKLRNNNLMRMRESLGPSTENYRQFFRSILNSGGSMALNVTFFSAVNETDYYGIIFEAEFSFDSGGPSVEYEYLSFVKGIRLTDRDILNPSSIVKREAEENELEKGRVRITVKPGSDMSLDLSSEGGAHRRSLYRESFSRTEDISAFRDQGNKITVSDWFVFSPVFIFAAAAAGTVITVAALSAIWIRNRFRKMGLILPAITALMAPVPIVIFYRPGLNIYGMHDIAILIVFLINLFLLAACYLVNPRGSTKYSTYEEEKGEKFEMPKVVYVDRTVYIQVKGFGKIDGLDPYEVLGVSRNMSLREIEEEYKKEILKYHPDKYEKSTEAIKKASLKETERLNAAFEYIKNRHGQ